MLSRCGRPRPRRQQPSVRGRERSDRHRPVRSTRTAPAPRTPSAWRRRSQQPPTAPRIADVRGVAPRGAASRWSRDQGSDHRSAKARITSAGPSPTPVLTVLSCSGGFAGCTRWADVGSPPAASRWFSPRTAIESSQHIQWRTAKVNVSHWSWILGSFWQSSEGRHHVKMPP